MQSSNLSNCLWETPNSYHQGASTPWIRERRAIADGWFGWTERNSSKSNTSSISILTFWNPKVLESPKFWNPKVLKFQSFGIPKSWNPNVLESQSFGILKFWTGMIRHLPKSWRVLETQITQTSKRSTRILVECQLMLLSWGGSASKSLCLQYACDCLCLLFVTKKFPTKCVQTYACLLFNSQV